MADNFTAKDGSGNSITIGTTDLGSGTHAHKVRIVDATAANIMPTMDAAARKGFVSVTDGTNTMPTMDAAARKGFVSVTDGTNTMPTMDAVARAGFVQVTNGTQSMPTMDAAARKGFVAVTDGTNTATVKAASTGALATDTALVVRPMAATDGTNTAPTMDAAARAGFVKLTDGTNTAPTMDVAARKAFVSVTDGTNTQPTGDAVGRAIFHKITDGTNTATVKAASTPAAITDTAMVVQLSPISNLTHFKQRGLVGAAVAVKASAGHLWSIEVTNQDSSPAWIQIFNVATGGITLGTTVPDLEVVLAAGNSTPQTLTVSWPDGIPFGTAISVASTTTSGGLTGNAASKVHFHAQIS